MTQRTAISPPRITRLAPSPTGALHIGNARTFLINWALARQNNWRIVLRIEDLDSPRTKPDADKQAIEDLQWLGMDWDEGPLYQLHNLTPYKEALDQLDRQGLTYRCRCTRREIVKAQSAPHADEHELRYPGTCRPDPAAPPVDLSGTDEADLATRVIVPDESIDFNDLFAGPQQLNVQQHVGDFIVAAKGGLPAYQLAVVVDDARQGVTDIVRGDDLLSSAARQLWLYRFLDLSPPTRYCHVPLVLGPDGRRLAKRHGDTRIASYRERGVAPERLVGLLAHISGATASPRPMTSTGFRDRFQLDRLPPQPVTFTLDHDAWLTEETLAP